MPKKTNKRSYGTTSYADSYFWATAVEDHLISEIRDAIGDRYIDEETQISNILSQLRAVGYSDLAEQFLENIRTSENIIWR